MKTSIAACALSALAVSALAPGEYEYGGIGAPYYAKTDLAKRTIVDARQSPNISSTVKFPVAYNDKNETWAWRLDVTDLAAPDSLESKGLDDLGLSSADYSAGMRLLTTHWDLEWPGAAEKKKQTFQSFLDERGLIANFRTFFVPAGPNQWRTRQSDGSCAGILPDECIADLKNSAFLESKKGVLGCSLIDGDGPAPGMGTTLSSAFWIPHIGTEDVLPELLPGGTVHSLSTISSKASHNITYHRVSTALNVLIMGFAKRDASVATSPPETIVRCQIVERVAPPPPSPGAAFWGAVTPYLDSPNAPFAAGVIGLVISRYFLLPMLR